MGLFLFALFQSICVVSIVVLLNMGTSYYVTVKTMNLVIRFSKQQTQEVQLKHKEISLQLDFFHAKSYHIGLSAKNF